MRYADPHACPDCRGTIQGHTQCPSCGFDLTSAEALALWNLFHEADRLVATGRRTRAAGPTPPTPPIQPTAPAAMPPRISVPMPAPVVSPEHRSLSVGSVLLGLGGLALVVAALIFASVAWGVLGIVGRATILGLVTIIWAFGLRSALRRNMRGTSETIAFIVLGMVTVNWAAARSQGLFGFDRLDWGAAALLWTGILLVVGLWIQRAARTHLERHLIAAEVFVAVSAWFTAGLVVSWLEPQSPEVVFWAILGGALVPIVLTVVLALTAQKWGAWVGAAGALLWITGASFVAVVDHATSSVLWDWHTVLPLIFCALAGFLVATLVSRVRTAALVYAFLALSVLILGSGTRYLMEHSDGGYSFGIVASVLLLGALLAAWASSPVQASLRWTAAVLSLPVLMSGFGLAFVTIVRIADASRDRITLPMGKEPWWDAGALAMSSLALAMGVLAATRWAAPSASGRALGFLSATWIALAGTSGVLVMLGAPFLLHGLVMALGVGATAWCLRHSDDWWLLLLVPPALTSLIVIPFGSLSAFAVWLAVAVVLGAMAGVRALHADGADTAFLAAGATALLVSSVGHLVGASQRPSWWALLAVLIAASAAACVAMALHEWPQTRRGVDAAALASMLMVTVLLLDEASHVALGAAIAGLACLAVALADDERRWFSRWSGGFLGLAWIARLVMSDVSTVEAYTAPFAVVALVLGLIAVLRDKEIGTWRALGPGLTLAFLPSLPFVLAEPAGLRAACWGFAGLVVLLIGVARRWQAAFVSGALSLLIVIVANVGPVILGLHRWLLLGAVGLVLLALGITWERRVTQGRAIWRRVSELR